MKYTKPEITVVENALAAVQYTLKPEGNFDSILNSTQPSVSTYESDE